MKPWWNILRRRRQCKLVIGQLQQQRLLLQQGVRAYARIIEIEEHQELLKGYISLKLWVMIRLQEKLLYQLVNTLVADGKVPVIGEVVPIRLLPDQSEDILILA